MPSKPTTSKVRQIKKKIQPRRGLRSMLARSMVVTVMTGVMITTGGFGTFPPNELTDNAARLVSEYFPSEITQLFLPSQTAKVCTKVASGQLRVRAEAGENKPELGILSEGTTLQINMNVEAVTEPDGGTWIKLLAPITGWVNQRFVCVESP